jgi:hypothetical protein
MLPEPRVLSGVGLLAAIPAALFIVGRSDPWVALAIVNVLIIVASVAQMVGPAEGEHATA